MKGRFYPDVNVIQYYCSSWSPSEFRNQVDQSGYTFVLGTHVCYELARGAMKRRSREPCAHALRFLLDIRSIVEILPDARFLINAEFQLAVSGVPPQ